MLAALVGAMLTSIDGAMPRFACRCNAAWRCWCSMRRGPSWSARRGC